MENVTVKNAGADARIYLQQRTLDGVAFLLGLAVDRLMADELPEPAVAVRAALTLVDEHQRELTLAVGKKALEAVGSAPQISGEVAGSGRQRSGDGR